MDNFMDRLAQKFNAQELIKANSAAEAAEHKRLQEQLAAYDECLKEMRSLNLTNVEMSEKLNSLIDEVTAKVYEISLPVNDSEEDDDTEDVLIQIEEVITALKEEIEPLREKLTSMQDQVTDHVHKENVKVYRNVQAVVVEELAKQTEALKEENKTLKKFNVTLLVFSILGTCSSVALLVLYILSMFKII